VNEAANMAATVCKIAAPAPEYTLHARNNVFKTTDFGDGALFVLTHCMMCKNTCKIDKMPYFYATVNSSLINVFLRYGDFK
jgi:hypothetical protein